MARSVAVPPSPTRAAAATGSAATATATATATSSRREALLQAALELFNREGYRAVGIDALLQQAGVAKMTLYKHFRSKEELIAAVLERRGETLAAEIVARVEAVPVEAPDPARARLLAVFAWLEDWLRSPGFQGCLFAKAAGEYPDDDDLPRRAATAFKDRCRELLEQLCADLGGPDPLALARQLELLIEGAAAVGFLRRDPTAASSAARAAAVLIDAARPVPTTP
ncbi:transcriptional regulator, TetR family [Cyanobium sp. PCC 7001]|uniref:TetR/AcrR family transcriptional regulator n=1 Tax=Cyanobium sp. PCC 7001 TaxID=180281 RepID=UPI0001804C78|nr:TetR/AcrR family transcriptional regulator [Cyanobium sp. PCC 7001]EDY38297.1 transcriptional regulator, TetR family [Cyanobium sp. PCC 7001]